jgi:hypothetical protein
MTPKWLSGLVRARQAQEDFAKQELATAQRLAHRAHARVRYDAERLDSLIQAGAQGSAPAFVAAHVALQAAAATHAAAIRAAAEAVEAVSGRRGDLSSAATARRSVEEMRDRRVAAEQVALAAKAQQELDEVAGRIHRDGDAR